MYDCSWLLFGFYLALLFACDHFLFMIIIHNPCSARIWWLFFSGIWLVITLDNYSLLHYFHFFMLDERKRQNKRRRSRLNFHALLKTLIFFLFCNRFRVDKKKICFVPLYLIYSTEKRLSCCVLCTYSVIILIYPVMSRYCSFFFIFVVFVW